MKEKLIKKLKLEKKKIAIISIGIIAFIAIFMGYGLAKYINQNQIKNSTGVAKPIIELENGESVEISNQNKLGEYTFKVKNYNQQNEISDVNLNYNVEIISKEDEAIKYKLYKEDEEIEVQNNKSKDMKLIKSEKEEHNYTLKILYDETKNVKVTDLIQDIQIKIHSEQEKIANI